MAEHGTVTGYGQHYRDGESPCADCRQEMVRYNRAWRQQQRDEQEARRARWRQQSPREAAILAAHADGGLTLG